MLIHSLGLSPVICATHESDFCNNLGCDDERKFKCRQHAVQHRHVLSLVGGENRLAEKTSSGVAVLVSRRAQSCRRRNAVGNDPKVTSSRTDVERFGEHFQPTIGDFPVNHEEGKPFVSVPPCPSVIFLDFQNTFRPSVFLMRLV